MSEFDRPGTMLDEPAKRRAGGSWFADLGDRLARTFGGVEPGREAVPAWEPGAEEEYQPVSGEEAAPWNAAPSRFPITRHGYDRAAVDAHIAELERELARLRTRRSPTSAVAAEIEQVGEQTAAILRVAHEQSRQITRRAEEQADKCVADAAANAVAMTEDANRRLRELDHETDVVWRERSRLIEDVRSVATALFSLAEDAADRFPGEPVDAEARDASASEPGGEATVEYRAFQREDGEPDHESA